MPTRCQHPDRFCAVPSLPPLHAFRGARMLFRNVLLVAAIAAASFLLPIEVSAHSGGLNAEGCHNNRKTGDYHCHRGSAKPAAAPAYESPYRTDLNATSGSTGRAFANCSEARAAGAAPVRRGDPGYSGKLDRDGDGVGCE